MVRRNEVIGIAIVATVCLLLIVFCQKESSIHKVAVKYQSLDLEASLEESKEGQITIEDVIERQRLKIKRALYSFNFPENKTLNNLTLATGGQPIRTVIIATWRSGSTFLGDILNALPSNFYHYEPLLHYEIMQIRGAPYSDTALATIKSLLNCNYSNLQRYLEFGMSHTYLFTHNTRLWYQCEMYPQFCWNPTFLSQFCKLFPFQSTKLVRLRLWLAEDLIRDEELNVKVILLVRDPRGILQSRKHRAWCPGEPDCDQPSYLCADMVSDYSAAIQLQKKYPKKFRAIRYEDLSLNPFEVVENLFQFIGLQFHSSVKRFLDSHTTISAGGVSSTFRDSKSIPFHWKTDLNYSEVQYIEENCDEAMKLWGYVRTKNSNLRDFYPLTSYRIE